VNKTLTFIVYICCGLGAFALADKFKEFSGIILFISGYFTCKICQVVEN
jgi:hypothetical protein